MSAWHGLPLRLLASRLAGCGTGGPGRGERAPPQNKPDHVRRVLRAPVRALRYAKANREGSLPTFMAFLTLPRERAEQAHHGVLQACSDDGTVSERALRFTIEAEKKDLKLTADVPADRVADFGPLYEVLGELGLTPAAGRAR